MSSSPTDYVDWLGAIVEPLDVPPTGVGPLDGLRAGIKDLIAVAGVPRRCGGGGVVDETAQPRHATVVERMLAAGARVVATTATHQLAFGIIAPQVRNPRAHDRVAGGSSGGAAAALAAGLVDVALGTDTGGSVRIPAACCGVAGLKTTRGLVPLTGVQPLAWSLDTVGPLATDVAGCTLMLDVLAGPDPADPDSLAAELGPAAPAPWTIGVPLQTLRARLDPQVRQVWQATLAGLERGGSSVVEVDIPLLDEAPAANGRILVAEAGAVHERTLTDRGGGLWPDVRARLEQASTLSAVRLAEAYRHRTRLRHALRSVFSDVDVLVTPTLPVRVPHRDEDPVVVDGREEPRVLAMTRLTNPWNLTGVPAGSVTGGLDEDGVPVGVQVIGPDFSEPTVLAVMAAIEELAGGPLEPVQRASRR